MTMDYVENTICKSVAPSFCSPYLIPYFLGLISLLPIAYFVFFLSLSLSLLDFILIFFSKLDFCDSQ